MIITNDLFIYGIEPITIMYFLKQGNYRKEEEVLLVVADRNPYFS